MSIFRGPGLTSPSCLIANLPSPLDDDWVLVDERDFAPGAPGNCEMAKVLRSGDTERVAEDGGEGPSLLFDELALQTLLHDAQNARDHYWDAHRQDSENRKHSIRLLQIITAALSRRNHELSSGCLVVEELVRELELQQRRLDESFHYAVEKEHCLKDVEDRVVAQLGSFRLCCPRCLPSASSSPRGSSAEVSDAPPPTPMSVEEFFRLARLAFVAHERLSDFDLQHEAVTIEGTGAVQAQEMSSSASSIGLYRQKRQVLLDAWSAMQHQMEVQREACRAEGVDPELYRYRRFSDSLPNGDSHA